MGGGGVGNEEGNRGFVCAGVNWRFMVFPHCQTTAMPPWFSHVY